MNIRDTWMVFFLLMIVCVLDLSILLAHENSVLDTLPDRRDSRGFTEP